MAQMTKTELRNELLAIGIPSWALDVEAGGIYVDMDIFENTAKPSQKLKAQTKQNFDKGVLFLAA